jgi:hypothetical protein
MFYVLYPLVAYLLTLLHTQKSSVLTFSQYQSQLGYLFYTFLFVVYLTTFPATQVI